MTLQQLRYVTAIAEAGTLSEAARRFYIAQPSLTASLRELEEELGLTIFRRTNRGAVLTPEGEEFLGYARQVLAQMDLMEEKYLGEAPVKHQFCVSTQHYSFAVEAFVELLREYGVRLVYVTMGPRGCYFANHSGSGTTACPTGIHVVDTTGAGDIFGGSAMSQMLKLDKAPEALSAEDMSAITRFACCAASLSTRHHGGINSIPEEQEVLELMRQG